MSVPTTPLVGRHTDHSDGYGLVWVELLFPDYKRVVDLDRARAYLDFSLHALGRKAGVRVTETLIEDLGRQCCRHLRRVAVG
jgi:hypothetical protein